MIPKTFQLGGRTWRVKRRVTGRPKKEYGRTSGNRCVIELTVKNKTEESEEHTFYHELAHAIGFTMGWKRLIKDEEKVDAIGGLLRQFITTASFED